jgi:hypothetical protein
MEHFQEKHAPGLIGVESGFPAENATTQKCWSGFCFLSM